MTVTTSEYSFFGAAATYTPSATGVPASVTIIIDDSYDRDIEGDRVTQKAEISVRQSEVSARPGYRDKFVLTDGAGNSQTWYVLPDGVMENRALQDFNGEWLCMCENNERPVR